MDEPVLPDREIWPLPVLPGHNITRSLIHELPQVWSARCTCFWMSKEGNLDFVTGAAQEHIRVTWDEWDKAKAGSK